MAGPRRRRHHGEGKRKGKVHPILVLDVFGVGQAKIIDDDGEAGPLPLRSSDTRRPKQEQEPEVKNLFQYIGLPTKIKSLNLKKVWEIMNLDKKVKDGKVNFVLLKDIGKPMLKAVNEKSFYKAAEIIL